MCDSTKVQEIGWRTEYKECSEQVPFPGSGQAGRSLVRERTDAEYGVTLAPTQGLARTVFPPPRARPSRSPSAPALPLPGRTCWVVSLDNATAGELPPGAGAA